MPGPKSALQGQPSAWAFSSVLPSFTRIVIAVQQARRAFCNRAIWGPMARIFINYRRDDTPGVAGRLFDHLVSKYSRRELFMDVDAMQPGIDFAQQLDKQVAQ